MGRFPLNFSAIDDKAFPVYPVGTYTLRVIEARMETAKNSGELKETVTFEIVDGPNKSPEFAGKKIITSYSLQQQAGFRIKKLLGACGIPPERMADMDDQELVGNTIKATISVENYQGRQTNRVGNEEPLTGNGQAPAQSFPAPSGFAAPNANGGPAPGAPPAGFAPPQGGPPSGQWAPQWGAPGQAPAPPPAKPAGK